MKLISGAALLALAACGRSAPEPRLATKEETASIVSAVVARTVRTESNVCFNREITPALERQRDMWRFFPVDDEITDDEAKSWFVPVYPPEPRPVALELGRELEAQLTQAAKRPAEIKSTVRGEEVFPRRLLAPADPSKGPCGRPGMTEYTLSEPIIVGTTAFVENGGVCGGLCGGGSIDAYRKINGAWRLIARRPTWIA